jgi:8-oxo-dGTP diphosphatase
MPSPRPEPNAPKRLRVVAAILVESGCVLAAKRGPAMRMPGRWEFPGGKVEPGETDRQALRRELREELAVDVRVTEPVGTVVHRYATFEIELVAYRCTNRQGELEAREHETLLWLTASELEVVAWSDADLALLPDVSLALATEPHVPPG